MNSPGEASDASREDGSYADAREHAGGHREPVGLRALVHLPEEGARADRHARGRRVASRRVHPAEVDEDRAVAHAELGVAAAAQGHGHAVAVVFGGTPEAALDPGGDEADREDHVAFARGLERARGRLRS